MLGFVGDPTSRVLLDGNVMSVIGLLLSTGARSFIVGSSPSNNLTLSEGSSSLSLHILVKPKLEELFNPLSYLSSTICYKLSWPMIVCSGCSASEKKGFRYRLLSIPFSTQKTV